MRGELRLNKNHAIFLMVLVSLVSLKYFLPWLYNERLSAKASMMDGKWTVYAIFAVLWVNLYGYPTIEKMYKYCVFFSIVYIANALFAIVTGDDIERTGLLMESNYDGFMILMIYCFSTEVMNRKKWEDGVLLAATFLTLSRTGFASLFVIWIVRSMKKNTSLLILVVPIILAMVHFGVAMRGIESVYHLDRFVYWEQAFVAFKHEDFWAYVFGNIPGKSLEMPVIPEFSWTIDMFGEMKNLRGIYPFMFHSTYLRLAFTWGIPVAILFAVYLIRKYFKSKYMPLKLLCLITLIQSFSLSSLTLPNVSVLLFICFMLALRNERNLKSQRVISKQ